MWLFETGMLIIKTRRKTNIPSSKGCLSRLTIVFTIQNIIYYEEDYLAWASKDSVDLEYRRLPTWRKYN